MKLRELLRKINDSVRPIHVEGSGSDPLLDGRVAGRAGNLHSAPSPLNTTDWAPSQQDEEPHPMKLRHLLKKLRLQSLEVGEDARAGEDNVDALSVGTAHTHAAGTGDVAPLAPPNWVPSQQDGRPRY